MSVPNNPTSNVERRVGFQGPNMKVLMATFALKATGKPESSERMRRRKVAILGKRKSKLLASVGRKECKKEDKETNQMI